MEEEIDVNPQYVKKANSNQEEDLSPGQGLKMSYSSMNMPGVKEWINIQKACCIYFAGLCSVSQPIFFHLSILTLLCV